MSIRLTTILCLLGLSALMSACSSDDDLAGTTPRTDAALDGAGLDGSADGTASEAIQLLDLSVEPSKRLPYRLRTLDEGRDLILEPLRPLRPSTACSWSSC